MSAKIIDELTEVQPQAGSLDAENSCASSPGASSSAAALATAALLAACGGGGGGEGGGPGAGAGATEAGRSVTLNASGSTLLNINLAPTADDAKISRFLQQAQFAATDADIAAVKARGYKAWLESQTAMPYNKAWDWLNSQGFPSVDSSSNQFADDMVWSQIIGSPDAYRRRAALALSQILVVSLEGLDFKWRTHTMTAYWDILCKHALGNYRDLLQDVTLSPAMGYYLNAKGSVYRPDIQPDENFAREVMQLFTIGLVDLNGDGTPKKDANNNTIDSYTGADVSAIAHVFTGWDIDTSQGGTSTSEFTRRPMVFNKGKHSSLEVKAFDDKLQLPGATDGLQKINDTLDFLFMHPNTPPFVCKRLIQSLVTSDPSPAYVARVAAKFVDNGATVRGDMAHVFAAILLDDEARKMPSARSTAERNEFGKLREPMVRLVQWARTFGVRSATGRWNIGDLTESDQGAGLAQSPLRSPSVFNFFKPGFILPGSTPAEDKVAPEFQLVNETSVSGYLNCMVAVIEKGINNQTDMKAAYTAELALATNPRALVDRLNMLLCGGQLSATTVDTIVKTLETIVTKVKNVPTVTDKDRRNRVYAAVLMVMACPGYLIQK